MSEKPSKEPYSIFRFWRIAIGKGWDGSREKFGLVVDITLALTAVGLFVFAWYSKRHADFNAERGEANMNYWFALIPVGLWLLWFIYHVWKAPHEIYMEQHREIERLEEQIKRLTDEEAKVAEAEKLKKGKRQMIANCIIDLENRITEVQKIGGYAYHGEVKKKACEETDVIIDRMVKLLDAFFDPLVSTRFAYIRASAISYPTDIPDEYMQRRGDLASHISYLENHKADILKLGETI
jgi:hypothetical protein